MVRDNGPHIPPALSGRYFLLPSLAFFMTGRTNGFHTLVWTLIGEMADNTALVANPMIGRDESGVLVVDGNG